MKSKYYERSREAKKELKHTSEKTKMKGKNKEIANTQWKSQDMMKITKL